MKIETRPEGTKNIYVVKSVDVDPGHALIVEMRKEFFRLRNGAFFEMRTIVLDQGDNGPAVGRFFARAQQTRRLTRNGITCLEHTATLQCGSAGGEWKDVRYKTTHSATKKPRFSNRRRFCS